jgi:hypothetical protein
VHEDPVLRDVLRDAPSQSTSEPSGPGEDAKKQRPRHSAVGLGGTQCGRRKSGPNIPESSSRRGGIGFHPAAARRAGILGVVLGIIGKNVADFTRHRAAYRMIHRGLGVDRKILIRVAEGGLDALCRS